MTANDDWRRHGKLYRANIVLTDENSEGNTFSLSNTCSINRYYRVADRVLTNFLSSRIAERNELIESYLIGNRLFKFLSVVLPSHPQYFDKNSMLESLRYRSEAQLMELLEYMSELEMMIDEMEYNRYILNDLIPEKDDTIMEIEISGSASSSHKGSSDSDGLVIRKKDTIHQALIQQKYQTRHQTKDDEYEVSGGNVREIEASDEKKINNATTEKYQKHYKVLKERVAAVVTATNSSSNTSNDSRRYLPSVSSSDTKSFSSHTSGNRGIVVPVSEPELQQPQQVIAKDSEYNSSSWDADFSQFNNFSDAAQNSDNLGFNSFNHSWPTKSVSPQVFKPLPKIKTPPVYHRRSVRIQSEYTAAQLPPPLRESKSSSSSNFYSSEDPGSFPVKTKIEERIEQAAAARVPRITSSNTTRGSFNFHSLDDYSLVKTQPDRNLLNHFKGCVKFLL